MNNEVNNIINISDSVLNYLKNILLQINNICDLNKLIYTLAGIKNFTENESDLDYLKNICILNNKEANIKRDKEYGDYQTNSELANKILLYLKTKNTYPQVIIEPTCGKGNFIIGCLNNFTPLTIYGIEIYKPYIWETKFKILDYFIKNPKKNKPDIELINADIFLFDFENIKKQHSTENILIIGNPPWVTNSSLSSINSNNLPVKTNFKNQNGLDSITGKGNFDVAEYILFMLFDAFHNYNGNIALLVKNSVIKNIMINQIKSNYKISDIEKLTIDAKKEFNVSVEASLFYCKLNSKQEYKYKNYDFYNYDNYYESGWVDNKFVFNVEYYSKTKQTDGICQFEWRQGIKHDCSLIMELEKTKFGYINGLNEQIILEEDLIYNFLKSSDLKNSLINSTRKYIIITQKKVGESTDYIQTNYPQTHNYLFNNKEIFNNRKSIIYKNKPAFSIFGIGDYSFKPFKVAISGFYNTFDFTLILPINNKAVMLDDTCYFLGFDLIEYAVYTVIILNSEISKEFLKSIIFNDSKRIFTKDTLMRIDLLNILKLLSVEYFESKVIQINEKYKINITLNLFENYLKELKPKKQVLLFK